MNGLSLLIISFMLTNCGVELVKLEPSKNPGIPESKNSSDQEKAPDEPKTEEEASPAPQNLINYQDHIKAIIEAHCLSCHNEGGTPPALEDYAAVKSEGELSLSLIVNKAMPPSEPLGQTDQILFRAWVQTGFAEASSSPPPKNTPPPPSSDPEEGLSFAKDIAPILNRSCAVAGCHNEAAGAGGYEFETLEGTIAGVDDGLLTIEDGSMPLGTYPKVTAEEVALIEQWISEGQSP